MQLSEIKEYQHRLVRLLERQGLAVSLGNDLTVLLKTYAAATGTGYVQLPFVVDNPKDASPLNFWVSFDDGNAPVALTGYRTLRNSGRARHVGEAYARGALYEAPKTQPEAWRSTSGPLLEPYSHYGYIGAGWVHPRFRGHNLAGFIARIAQAEALVRTGGALSVSTAMTVEALFRSGMNVRASGLHHLHVEQVLDGYFRVINSKTRLFLSYSTNAELQRMYQLELDMLRKGEPIPWLQKHDKSMASEILGEPNPVGAWPMEELTA
ncbi:MAG: hypothetical protein KKC79_07135 [Gammaproteobacteria bacterium]|nr:hypothetical protein [Gammaproteobacteria bacterium]MBU1443219.1 hypothetical protein [Gammaproteobacteria bacterium]MBU2408409.1 hypothetical protein [Gammaproteobacteria bacterium]